MTTQLERIKLIEQQYEDAQKAMMDYCHGCGCGGKILHVDMYHRLTPLCTDCYYDPIIAKRTASNPDDPESWWNKPEYLEN
jgi:hypothetical protein